MNGWQLVYHDYNPRLEGVRETLCTLGNGYFATRGATVESFADGIHYPGTYIAGCYNRLTTEIDGQLIENEDMVNMPNWLTLTFRHEGENWLGTEAVTFLNYECVLDLRKGMLIRDLRVRDREGRITRLQARRIVHMSDPHYGAVEITLTAENWSGRVETRAALDGWVANLGVERYRLLSNRHLEPVDARAVGDDSMLLSVRTSQSGIVIAEAARTRVFVGRQPLACTRTTLAHVGYIAQDLGFEMQPGVPVRIEKVVAIYTSRDHAISEPCVEAITKLGDAGDFEELLASHSLAWEQLWRSFEIDLSVDGEPQRDLDSVVVVRLHVFHLLQTASRNSIDLDVGIGARGLSGEGYRGHVFWDELFVFPFLNMRMPDITRGLLMYRYRRLDWARRAARASGYRGAMFPWQSGSDGREETPKMYLNMRSGRWIKDETHLQRHVGAAIAYNVWQYYQVTGDRKFLEVAGAELMLEIARFFASHATYNEILGRFEIRGVMGPDEYHSHYPDACKPGLDNNTYTNVMAVWVLLRAFDVLDLLPPDRARELRETLALEDAELKRWNEISKKMRLVFLDNGVPAQFDGYEKLKELDWDAYRARYGNIQRLDLILEAEGDDINRYKVSKQADVLMLFFLFRLDELSFYFDRLGYTLDREVMNRTIDYYLHRTSDGSTLSRVAHAWVLARANRAASWHTFTEALKSDVGDIQGGTTREGIHVGAMAGTVDVLQRCYTGLVLREDVLWIDPQLPEQLDRLALLVRYRTHTIELVVTHTELEVHAARSDVPSIRIAVRKKIYTLEAGERRRFALTSRGGGGDTEL
jgi:trehalose/maltose hydrolase-like predicted phosphorylase